MAKPIPDGYHTITAQLSIDGADKAIAFYEKAFGAETKDKAVDPSGKKIWHAELRIGDSIIFANDTMPEMPQTPRQARLWIYTEGVDRAFQRAKDAGLKAAMPPADMFWGDRMAEVHDRWGNQWVLAQHVKDLSPAEMKKAQDDFVASMKKK